MRGWLTCCLPLTRSRRPLISIGAFPELGEAQIATLVGDGECRMTAAGDVLYREGDLEYDFVVIREGKVAVIEGYEGPEQQVVGVHGPRRFLGEISLLTGQAAFVHGGGRRAGRGARHPRGAAPRTRAAGHRSE